MLAALRGLRGAGEGRCQTARGRSRENLRRSCHRRKPALASGGWSARSLDLQGPERGAWSPGASTRSIGPSKSEPPQRIKQRSSSRWSCRCSAGWGRWASRRRRGNRQGTPWAVARTRHGARALPYWWGAGAPVWRTPDARRRLLMMLRCSVGARRGATWWRRRRSPTRHDVVRRVRGQVPGVRYQAGDVECRWRDRRAGEGGSQPSPEGANPDGGAQVDRAAEDGQEDVVGESAEDVRVICWLHLRRAAEQNIRGCMID
jgi:hypothetical protein